MYDIIEQYGQDVANEMRMLFNYMTGLHQAIQYHNGESDSTGHYDWEEYKTPEKICLLSGVPKEHLSRVNSNDELVRTLNTASQIWRYVTNMNYPTTKMVVNFGRKMSEEEFSKWVESVREKELIDIIMRNVFIDGVYIEDALA